MSTTQPNFIFNETQRVPTIHQHSDNTSSKLSELALCISTNNECVQKVINTGTKKALEIQQTQEKILDAIVSLSTEFTRIDLSVKEIQDKLTQYDLDADEELADDADEGDADEGDADDDEGDSGDAGDEDEAVEELVKPKRKYTRKPKN